MRPTAATAAFFLAAAFASSCAPVSSFDPATGRVSAACPNPSLDAQGIREFEKYKRSHKVSANPSHQRRAQRIVNRLAPHVDPPGTRWEVVVFDDPKPNAFALPGGKIGLHTGVLPIAANEDGLATILAHEIAHVSLHHAHAKVNRASGVLLGTLAIDVLLASQGVPGGTRAAAALAFGTGASLGFMLPHSRQAEIEADQLGMISMARAGYDPREAPQLWRRFARHGATDHRWQAPEFLRTHPLDETRIHSLEQFLPVALRESMP